MYQYNCKIRRVVDGDTVDVDVDLGFGTWRCSERIRLFGVDTPEMLQRKLPDSWQKSLSRTHFTSEEPTNLKPKRKVSLEDSWE